ncbi:hypothetical protein BS50DRAFT_638644 [Corynespora cassiicola Philippines]|uniref:Uncharacterized protein n=1 Tax=Corynespora cassiicola Philippines TaxID=1448308 RepID=A0A2T2N9G5_CORCC|nr:hypothetical protein BS50DRAFT_638644 [Corynespora cassiicola Philippines]
MSTEIPYSTRSTPLFCTPHRKAQKKTITSREYVQQLSYHSLLIPAFGRKFSKQCTYTVFDHSILPQTPWSVPAGYYTRTDGSVIYIPGPSHFWDLATSQGYNNGSPNNGNRN